MLLLGLIGIVGLLLLAHSFKLSLVFLVVLGVSLLTGVSLRKLLLALQRSKQESGVVSTFWSSTTLFLISVLSWSAFSYFEEELHILYSISVVIWSAFHYFEKVRIPALVILAFTTLLVAVISFLVGLFILVFLRSKTGFPRWTVAPAVLLGIAGLMPIVWSMSKFASDPFPPMLVPLPRSVRPGEVFNVSYHAKITFRGKDVRVQEEYEIQPTSDYVFVSIDDEWLSRNPSVSIGPLRWFEAKKSAGALPGLFVTVDQEIGAHITELGLLRRKLELHS